MSEAIGSNLRCYCGQIAGNFGSLNDFLWPISTQSVSQINAANTFFVVASSSNPPWVFATKKGKERATGLEGDAEVWRRIKPVKGQGPSLANQANQADQPHQTPHLPSRVPRQTFSWNEGAEGRLLKAKAGNSCIPGRPCVAGLWKSKAMGDVF